MFPSHFLYGLIFPGCEQAASWQRVGSELIFLKRTSEWQCYNQLSSLSPYRLNFHAVIRAAALLLQAVGENQFHCFLSFVIGFALPDLPTGKRNFSHNEQYLA